MTSLLQPEPWVLNGISNERYKGILFVVCVCGDAIPVLVSVLLLVVSSVFIGKATNAQYQPILFDII